MYRVGIVGLGGISRVHARAVLDSPRTTLVAACDVSPEAVDSFLGEFELKCGYSDLGKLLQVEDLDIAIVCTWGPQHAPASNQISRSGSVRAILCEKPISQTETESRTMFETAAAHDVLLVEALKSLHHPVHLKAKSLLDDGAIGQLTGIRAVFTSARPLQHCTPAASWRYNRAKGGGIVYDLGCYVLHHARGLTGADPARVYATAFCGDEVEFQVSAVLDFPEDIVAQLTFSWRQFPSQYVEILGEQGEMRIDPAFNNESQQTGLQLRTQDSSECFEFEPQDPFLLQLEHLCDCIDGSIPHRIPPEVSIGNMRTIDAIHESINRGSAVTLA